MSDSEQLQIGALIGGKYRIDRVLGQGGMGIVYAATHVGLEQRVALKFLLRAAAAHPEMIERFAREARAAVRIQSEHVARVLDVGAVDPGIPFIVMELLEGESFEELLERDGRFAVPVAVDYVLQACEALAEAHSLGIVHRDIKPANLFRARKPGRSLVKVLDFGICKVPLDARAIGITGNEAMMGSPGYMSPEQVFGAAQVDVRTDVWALGAVLYHLVTGRPPFLEETMPALVTAVLHKPHPPVSEINPSVPASLAAAIDACLAKDPAHRPANVAVLANALVPCGPPGSAEVALRVAEVLGVKEAAPMPARAVASGVATQASQIYANSPAPERPIHVRDTTLAPTTAPPSARASWRGTLLAAAAVLAGLVFGGIVVRALLAPKHAEPGIVAAGTPTPPPPSAAPSASVVVAVPDPVPGPTATPSASPSAALPKGSVTRSRRPPPAATPSASAAPACQRVSYLDDQGEKHFKMVCP